MTITEAKNQVDCMALDKHMDDFYWNEDDTFANGEIEYQIRGYHNSCDFCSILVRFCDDDTHTYREFFEYNYTDGNWWNLFYDAFEDEVVEQLCERIEEKVLRKAGIVN